MDLSSKCIIGIFRHGINHYPFYYQEGKRPENIVSENIIYSREVAEDSRLNSRIFDELREFCHHSRSRGVFRVEELHPLVEKVIKKYSRNEIDFQI